MTKKKAYMVRYASGELDVAKRVSQRASKSEQQEGQIADLEATVAKQQRDFQKEIQTLSASLKNQAALIPKVSDRLEASKPALQVVADN
jgi:lipopolysaccharide biosynthesis regulator YciM